MGMGTNATLPRSYALLEATMACLSCSGDYQLASRFLLLLADLAPAVVLATSAAWDHVLAHELWPEVLRLAEAKPEDSEASNLCVLLALRCLAQLLAAGPGRGAVEGRDAKLKQACETLLLPLWRHAVFDKALKKSLRSLAKTPGPDLEEWARDPLGTSAKAVVSLCLSCGLLDEVAAALYSYKIDR